MARSPRALFVVALAAACVLLVGPIASAAPGDLDTSFDGDGIALTPIGTVDQAFGMLVQPDGKIVIVGSAFTTATKKDFAVVRYNVNGTLDTTFSGDGIATTNFATGTVDEATDVAIDSAARIVVVGSSTSGTQTDFAVARYLSDGSPDTSFDGDGRLVTDFASGTDAANAVAITPGDGVIAVGSATVGATTDFALARYGATGALDASFDGDGKATTDFAGDNDVAQAVAIDGAGNYVVGGSAFNGPSKDDFALARYDTTGALDPTFDSDGRVIAPGNDQGRDLAIDSNGRIVMAGSAFTGSTLDFALERFTSSGAIDTTFGKHGRVTTPIGTGNDGADALAMDANGTIVAAGYATSGSDRDFALARYSSDGAPVQIFGQGGVIDTNLGPADSGRDVAFDANGNIVLAGYATTGSNADFAVLRYLGAGYRVDGLIKRPSDITFTGDDVYSATGAGETRSAKGKLGSSVAFAYAAQNEGTTADTISVRGCADSPGFTVAYAHGAADVTADVEAGTFGLGPEATGGQDGLTITITVQPSATVGTAKTCKVTATSQSAPSTIDVVKAKVKAVS